MAKGPSGRIVIEVNPELKRELHAELAQRNLTLKAWFVQEATRFLENSGQLSLFDAENTNRHGSQVPGNVRSSAKEDTK